MNKNLVKHTNFLVVSYFLFALAYLISLVIFALKIIPSLLMQFMFLTDHYLIHSGQLDELVSSRELIITLIASLVLFLLVWRLLQGIIKSSRSFLGTRKYLQSLQIIKKNSRYSVFKSNTTLVFTAGLLRPQIYLSSFLVESIQKKQLAAILEHEHSHQLDRDPLRIFLLKFIDNFLPVLPFKAKIAFLLETAIELKSDLQAEMILQSKRPIIEALHSLLEVPHVKNHKVSLAYFNNLPERIQILVGLQKFNFQISRTIIVTLLFAALLLPATSFVASFYHCDHFNDCLTVFVANLQNLNSTNLHSLHQLG